ncbi:hypothetical protein BH09SUM1_BH09SUM1_25260 [soil metagenome]
MPCNDITEVLRIRVDAEDRVADYELIKRTCGRAVGERSLLQSAFAGQRAESIMALDAEEFADSQAISENDEETMVLVLKHFFAVQAGLSALFGHASAGPFDAVRVAAVTYEDNLCTLEAEIVIDAITEKIKSCGKCKGCGIKKVAVK